MKRFSIKRREKIKSVEKPAIAITRTHMSQIAKLRRSFPSKLKKGLVGEMFNRWAKRDWQKHGNVMITHEWNLKNGLTLSAEVFFEPVKDTNEILLTLKKNGKRIMTGDYTSRGKLIEIDMFPYE
ncbi:MAG: hypothetical protein Q7S21_06295 [archaeon]|nr:hypothetical protein [archaeon]